MHPAVPPEFCAQGSTLKAWPSIPAFCLLSCDWSLEGLPVPGLVPVPAPCRAANSPRWMCWGPPNSNPECQSLPVPQTHVPWSPHPCPKPPRLSLSRQLQSPVRVLGGLGAVGGHHPLCLTNATPSQGEPRGMVAQQWGRRVTAIQAHKPRRSHPKPQPRRSPACGPSPC